MRERETVGERERMGEGQRDRERVCVRERQNLNECKSGLLCMGCMALHADTYTFPSCDFLSKTERERVSDFVKIVTFPLYVHVC